IDNPFSKGDKGAWKWLQRRKGCLRDGVVEEVKVVGGFRDRGQQRIKRAQKHFVRSRFCHGGNDGTSAPASNSASVRQSPSSDRMLSDVNGEMPPPHRGPVLRWRGDSVAERHRARD